MRPLPRALPEGCNVKGYWRIELEDLIVVYDNKTVVMPKSVLKLVLNDYELAALAVRGASGLAGKELKCLLDSLKLLAVQLRAEELERKLVDEAKGRRPSFGTMLARLIADRLLLEIKGFTDMASEISYLIINDEVLWGSEADGFLEKRAGEVGLSLASSLAERAKEDPQKLRSAVTVNVIREAVKAYKRETMVRSERVHGVLASSLTRLRFEGGCFDVDSWFKHGVFKPSPGPSLHALPQRDFDVEKFMSILNELDGLDAVEAVAEEFVPELLEAVDSWVGPGDRGTLWKAIGYTIYPKMPFRKFFVLLGPSGSGKSTFLEYLHEALGQRNVASVTLQQLMSSRGEYYAAELKHKLANLADEGLVPSRGGYELLKALVGGSYITARTLYSKPFKFRNYAKMFFATNDEEAVKRLKEDQAVTKRMVVIEFSNSFPDNWRFKERLFASASRALPVMLAALRLLSLEGFPREDDLIKAVISLCKKYCKERRDGHFLPASAIRQLGMSSKELWQRLKELGVPCKYVVWHGRRGVVFDLEALLSLSEAPQAEL